jgi:hypothetical protein
MRLSHPAMAATAAAAVLAATAGAQIHIPLKHSAPPASTLQRRGDGNSASAHAALDNVPTYATYKLNISVGTPAQSIEVGLALGTWDSWLPVERSGLDSLCEWWNHEPGTSTRQAAHS